MRLPALALFCCTVIVPAYSYATVIVPEEVMERRVEESRSQGKIDPGATPISITPFKINDIEGAKNQLRSGDKQRTAPPATTSSGEGGGNRVPPTPPGKAIR